MQSVRPQSGIYDAYPVASRADAGMQTMTPVLRQGGRDVEELQCAGEFVTPRPPRSRKWGMIAGIGLGVGLFLAVVLAFIAVKLVEWHKRKGRGEVSG